MPKGHVTVSVILALLILAMRADAQLKTELSPAVSFHWSSTILRVWHMSKSDYSQMSDDDLEDVRVDLTETCQPKQGWTIEDGFYHDAAVGGILNELLVRTRLSSSKIMQEDAEAFRTLTAQRNQLTSQLAEALEENRALKDQLKKCAKSH